MRKKSIVLFGMMFILFYTPYGIAEQKSFPAGIVVTKKDPLRIRKGPGTQYEIIGKVQKGVKLLVIDDSQKDWYKVKLHDGTEGYASKQYIRILRSNPLENPPIPYEDYGGCPFEGCLYRDWTVKENTDIREDTKKDAPIVFTVKKGEKVTAELGVVVTTKPVRAKALQVVDLGGRKVRPGDIVYLYTPLGEGYMKVWFQGKMYEEGVPAYPPYFEGEGIIEYVWWVKIKNKQGQEGWTDETQNFGNKDRFSVD